MDDIRKQHYRLTVNFLSAVGLWPYTAKEIRRIQTISFQSLSTLFLLFQFTAFATMECTLKLVLSTLSPIIMVMGVLLKYNFFYFKTETVKEIMKRIKRDWNTIQSKDELQIIIDHAAFGKYYTKAFALFIYPSSFTIVMSQVTCVLFNIGIPSNVSHPCPPAVTLQFFLDEEINFYVNSVCLDLGAIVGTTIFVGTESMFFMWLQHTCSLLEITTYRIRRALFENSFQKHDSRKVTTMRQSLINAIDMHQHAVQFHNYIIERYLPSYILLLGLGVASLSINMFRLSQALPDAMDEALTSALYIFSEYGYMYYLYSMLQGVINCFADICQQTYDTNWYEAPVFIQKLILFIMLRSHDCGSGNLFGFCSMSLEGFLGVLQMSFSYFTVLYSTAKDTSD